jgi:hypothetical protein
LDQVDWLIGEELLGIIGVVLIDGGAEGHLTE